MIKLKDELLNIASKKATMSDWNQAIKQRKHVKIYHSSASSFSSASGSLTGRLRTGLELTVRNLTLSRAGFLTLMVLALSHSQCWSSLMLMCPFWASKTKFCSLRSRSFCHLRCHMQFLQEGTILNNREYTFAGKWLLIPNSWCNICYCKKNNFI